jgi:hypothetical protein
MYFTLRPYFVQNNCVTNITLQVRFNTKCLINEEPTFTDTYCLYLLMHVKYVGSSGRVV